MNKQNEQAIIEKINGLAPERAAEVDDFVDFPRMRSDERRLTQAATTASAPAFNKIWDNPEDADHDQL